MNRPALAFVVLLASTCGSSVAQDQLSWAYKPTDEALQRMSPDQARELIEKTAPVWLDKLPFDAWSDRLDGVKVHDDHVEYKTGKRANPAIRIKHEDLSRIELVRDTMMGKAVFGVLLDEVNVLWYVGGSLPEGEKRSRTMRLADALYVLKNYPLMVRREAESFERTAAWYRAQSPRPAFPEEARRARVQAEFFFEQRRFDDAARFYGDALKIAPWWPEGRFNRAMVLGELQRYPEAIAEMKRFLTLDPRHASARAGQDQIYVWEAAGSR